MRDFKIGKKLYRSAALKHFKIIFILIAIWIFINLYFKTYSDPDFIAMGDLTLKGVINFHYQYPVQIIGYILGTLIPSFYYAFIRGIYFFEDGMVINRGLPFLNHCVKYKDIMSFKIVHAKYLMSLKRKDVDEELLFTIQDIDRAVAIFDQHGIKGELKSQFDEKNITINKKAIIYFLIFGIIVSVIQYSGLMIAINRYLFR